MVCLTDYDCLGFDLDHTIIQYKLSNLFTVSKRFFLPLMNDVIILNYTVTDPGSSSDLRRLCSRPA